MVAEKAFEAWIEKLSLAIAGNTGNAKRWQIAIYSSALQSSLREAVEQLKIIAPRSKSLNKKPAKVIQSQRKRPFSGIESLIGTIGEVRRELNPVGAILVQGELWKAELRDESGPLPTGTKVTVVDRTGFKLWVKRTIR